MKNDLGVFDSILPSSDDMFRTIKRMVTTETAEGLHVVINTDLHLCQSENMAISVLDGHNHLDNLYVYCAETSTLSMPGIGIVTDPDDCKLHIREILQDAIDEPTVSERAETVSNHAIGTLNQAYEG